MAALRESAQLYQLARDLGIRVSKLNELVPAIMQYCEQQISQFMQGLPSCETLTEMLCAGAALINTSAAFRFVLSAVFLIKPLAVPYQVCGKFADAEAFARKMAPTKHIVLPPRLRCPWPDLGT